MNKTTQKKIRRTKSTAPSIPSAEKIAEIEKIPEYPQLTRKVAKVFGIIEELPKIDLMRHCAVGVQDLGIIDPIDGWANGINDLHERFSSVLFDENKKVKKEFIAPALALEKNYSTSEDLTMLQAICMMAGVMAFMETS
tara:strand:- start:6609 stop:7025 length:417 start_codon:yes stop_codon:yes gene_type:complete